jgi:hypothetical protein
MSSIRYCDAAVIPEAQRRANGDNARIAKRFHSLAEYAAVPAMTDYNREQLVRKMNLKSGAESKDWYGVAGGADKVLDLIKNGWPEGVQRMLDSFGKLTTSQTATSIKRIKARGDHGDEFDIHRAYSGGLDKAWSRRARGRRPSARCVSIYLSAAVSWNVNAESMFWRGAAALAITDLLSTAGYSVEVITGVSTDNMAAAGSAHLTSATTVKAASDPVNLNSLASSLCLAGFFRVLGFAQIHSAPFDVDSGLGQPANVRLSEIEASDTTIVIEGTSVSSEASARRWLEATLAGIEDGSIKL